MLDYFIRRFILIFPTFLGITLLVFVITRFVPGGPIEKLIIESTMKSVEGQIGNITSESVYAGGVLSEEQIAHLKEYYGFDKPILVSYFVWLKKILVFDFGYSLRYGEPVWDTIKAKLPISIFFGITTVILTYLICIPLGIIKALKHQKLFDNISSILVFTGYAIPSYVVAIFLLVIFAVHLELFPMGGFVSDNFENLSFWSKIIDLLQHTTLPLIAYLAGSFALMTVLMKNSLMENLSQDYMKTAMAKGLSFKVAVFKHALKNSLIPIATHFGNNISLLITGSFLIEKIFNINGFGLLGFESVVERDYPVVMGILVISSLLQLVGNILSDICVALIDPRIKFH